MNHATYYRKALEKIAKREGPFSRNRFWHARNTIEDMAQIAEDALSGKWEPDAD